MAQITEELIRRKAEHHDGLLADLEELSLHQLELEGINEVLGTVCRKVRILYLQNNIIPRLVNLQHLKELRYLNVALNNLTRVEGLASCEFLAKLDLTVNFVDVDGLEVSVANMAGLLHLRELYLMGNPCLEWEGARHYIIACLPQLERLDGKDITRSDRIAAAQGFKALRAELRRLAAAKRAAKGAPPEEEEGVVSEGGRRSGGGGGAAAAAAAAAGGGGGGGGDDDDDDPDAWTPENRVRMYRELAESKAEKEKRSRDLEPPRRDYKKEQAESVAGVRAREAAGAIKQCNEGRWEFSLDDEDGSGNVVVRLALSRYLDTSMIDVDVHPTYISVVIKSKVFRLAFPEEVRSSDAKCQRSTTTGELAVTVPKVSFNPTVAALRRKEKAAVDSAGGRAVLPATAGAAAAAAATAAGGHAKLGDEMVAASKAVKLAGIASGGGGGGGGEGASATHIAGGTMLFKEAPRAGGAAAVVAPPAPPPAPASVAFEDDDDVPPLE